MISTVFIGTSAFALPALEALHNDAQFRIVGVISQPAKPVGRKHELIPSPVAAKAAALGLTVWSPEKITEYEKSLALLKPDCLVVASYGQIIPQAILELPRLGAFNIHPSLLPKYRGASPIPAALLAGEKETGITIMLMDKEMDHGPILRQEKIKIDPDMTAPQLLEITARLGADLLIPALLDFNDQKLNPAPQRDDQATYSKILTREDGQIDFQQSAEQIYNQYRALLPWPGVYAHTRDGKKIKFLTLSRATETSWTAPGTLSVEVDKLLLQTKNGVLNVLALQLEGGKPLDAKTFINGYANKMPWEIF